MPPHHHHRWLFNAEGEEPPEQFGRVLVRVGEQLQNGRRLTMKGLEHDLPESVHAVVRKERTPHGRIVLKLQLEWTDDVPDSPVNAPLGGLLDG